MPEKVNAAPDPTAVRTALWRALHVQVDPPPHVFVDEVGLRLVAREEERYFTGRTDDLRPPSNSEELLVAMM